MHTSPQAPTITVTLSLSLWAQSYIKARGDGLGFEPLSRARFEFEGGNPWAPRARVVVDGKQRPRWCFRLHELPHGHWVSVAQGDPTDIVDAQQVCEADFFGFACMSFPRGHWSSVAQGDPTDKVKAGDFCMQKL